MFPEAEKGSCGQVTAEGPEEGGLAAPAEPSRQAETAAWGVAGEESAAMPTAWGASIRLEPVCRAELTRAQANTLRCSRDHHCPFHLNKRPRRWTGGPGSPGGSGWSWAVSAGCCNQSA